MTLPALPAEGALFWRAVYNAILQLGMHTHSKFVPPESGENPDSSRTVFTLPERYIAGSLVPVSNRLPLHKIVASPEFEEDWGIANLATATWLDSSGEQQLTQVGAFSGYTWASGDDIYISAGTGVTPGWYEIASRVDDDSITLTLDTLSPGVDLATGDIVSKAAYRTLTAVPLATGSLLWTDYEVAATFA